MQTQNYEKKSLYFAVLKLLYVTVMFISHNSDFFFSENFKKTNQNCGILRHNYLFIYLFFFYFVVETGFHKSQSPFTFNVCKRAA